MAVTTSKVRLIATEQVFNGQPVMLAESAEWFEDLTLDDQQLIIKTNRGYWARTDRYKWRCCKSQASTHIGNKAEACKFVHNHHPIIKFSKLSAERSAHKDAIVSPIGTVPVLQNANTTPTPNVDRPPSPAVMLETLYQSIPIESRKKFLRDVLRFVTAKISTV